MKSPLRMIITVFRFLLLALVIVCWGITGVARASIASENALLGNLPSEWDVNGSGDPSIQGFATDFSVNRGTTVQFKINTNASAYRIDIYRLGYYGGLGARKVATINPSASLPQSQPAFVSDPVTGLVDCGNWAVSASWAVPATATSGVYIARPVRTDNGGASHIIFVVRDDAGASDFLFQTADTTWQAYNNYGGINLYRYRSSPPYRAYKVSYNRPFNNRGATQFAERESFLFNSEYPMIRWMEANGYNVSYASGMDTDRRGSAALLTHKVFLSVGHDEYWSGQQRTNIEAARAGGVHLGFFSGNEFYWKTRWENSIAGPSTANRTLVCYKETHANAKIDPSAEWTGTWRDPRFSPPSDGGRPENAVTGQFWTVDAFRNDPLVISSSEGKARFWRNTTIAVLANGQTTQLPAGVLGFEWDEVRDNGFLPPGLVRMSTTTIAVDRYMQDYGTTVAPGTATHSLTLYRHSSGALVFGAGTVQWSWGLDATHDFAGTPVDVRMQQATVNLFADMDAQPATLQAGLVAATASTDTIAPTSVIQMTSGGTLQTGAPVTILGTAADTGGGIPAGVEFSYDGGATWHPASGVANWSGTWTPFDQGALTLKSRAVDDSGRIESPGPGVSATVSGGVVNGSFESGATGWTVTGNLVIGTPFSVATHGAKLVAFNNGELPPNGVLSQTFATVPGQSYTLAFDVGVVAFNTNSQSMLVTVAGTSSLLSQSITLNNALGDGVALWVPKSFTFVANSASSTLTFRDQSATTASLDLLLDKVRVTGAFQSQAATPTFNPAGGTYTTAQSVTLSDTSPGAAIYYTTNGSTPTTSSTLYTTPITVATTTTIKAMAVVTGWLNSAVASATYTIQAPAPAAPSGLAATAVSASQINLTWVDNATNETGFKIERKTGAGGSYAQIATVGANVTTFSNTGLTAGTTYFYRVRATNSGGDSAYSVEASAMTVLLSAPSGLTATAISTSQITLTWVDNSTNETGFKIERKTGVSGTYAQIATVGKNVKSYANTGLTAGTVYFYRVRATNSTGDSAYSLEASATPAAGPAAPSVLTATAVSASQINLTWVDNASDETGFRIERKTGAGGTYAQIATAGVNVTAYADTGLTAGTTYFYRVRSTNANGDSAYSPETSATSLAPPSAPSGLAATVASASQINLTWVDNATNETGFKIERKTGSAGTYTQIATAGVNATTYTDTGLIAGTTYFYQVRATNAIGDSAYSAETSATPNAVPAAPSGLTATAVSTSQINLTWVDNASNETAFKIERKTGAGGIYAQIAIVGINATTHADTGLVAGTTYFYRVRATNVTGDSAYSPETSATSLALPAAPSGFTATAVSASQINLTWVDNASDETGFKIERKTGAGGIYAQIATVGVNVTTYADSGLTAGNTYFYRVRSTNATGDSAYATEASATPAVVSASLTNGSFESNFTGWTVTGNAFIESTPYYIATDGVKLVSFNGNSTSDVAPTGVISQNIATVPGTTYALAFDMGVTGSAAVQQILRVTMDGTGNLLTRDVVKSSNGTFTSQWTANSYTFVANSATATLTFRDISTITNGIDTILDNVRVSSSSQAAPPTFSPVGGTYAATQSVTLSDTSPGATIYYTTNGSTPTASSALYTAPITVAASTTIKAMAVVNGWLDSTVTSATYTIQGAPPAAPSGLTATAVLASQINLTWVDNASDETGFKIERKTGAGGTYAQIATAGANATTYSNTGLTAATVYFYRVRATNANGDSTYSTEASAIPSAGPAAPSGLTVTSVSASQINLAWVDNATDETGFKIERKTGAGGTYSQIATAGVNATTYSNTGLTTGTVYFYRVRATNAAGDSAYSPEASATPAAAPAVVTNGSFESNFTGWTATGNAFIESTPYYTATDGVKLVSFNGNSSSDVPATGVVSQAFATIPGLTYTLVFDMGATGSAAVQQKLRVTVDGIGNLLTQDVTKSSNGTFTSQWTANSFTFAANSATTTLTFRDISATTTGVDALLDNVRVTASGSVTPPLTVNDSSTIHSGQKVRLAVLANDAGTFDPNLLEIVSPPATGTATIVSSGEILYTHPGTSTTPVSFTYRVSGAVGQSPVATVNIAISSALRIPNNQLNVPAAPPLTAVDVVPAFPGVSLVNPLCFASPPGDTQRLFICELGGKIKVIPDVTAATPTASQVLDLVSVITAPARSPAESFKPGTDGEAGLLGMAFHPNYATNGYFYVAYMVVKANDSSVWYHRLSRFKVPAAQLGQPAPVADPTSERILIEQRDRDFGLNGGDLHFGADGYLYWPLGDEGFNETLTGNAQRIDLNFFGAMLRIDVDKKPGNLEPSAHPNPAAAGLGLSSVNAIPRDEIPAGSGNFVARYSIPIDNPYVSTSKGGTWNGTFNGAAISAANLPYVRSEFWAVGLRSPWRFSIDEPTGDIWVGDVGLHTYEELDVVTKGGNYGWAYREGKHSRAYTPPAGFTSTDPIYEYSHTGQPGDSTYQGNSIIGGVVYRGSRFASLSGAYIFGDHISGHIWALTRPGGVPTVERIAGQPAMANFGVDPSNGDVLTSDYFGGRIMRIVSTTPGTGFPNTLTATGLFADLTDLSPAPGVLPYQPNLAFWSDYAVKRRWFIIPGATSTMTWSRDGSWTFPAGQIWVKHFDLETERGNPASPKKRIETRVLVKNAGGVYGVSYRWNDAGTEATLAADGGEDFPVNLTVNGAPYTQQWTIPSRAQCITCHSPQAGYSLSFNTRQLNLDNTINGFPGNQLDLLRVQGYFSNTPDSPALLPRYLRPGETAYSLEDRARSYLAVNCSYCHAGAAGTAPAAWDGRPELTLDQTGLINGATSQAGGAFRLIVPGDTAHSVVLQRMGATGGFTRMPPLGTHETDPVDIALVTDWINQLVQPSSIASSPLGITSFTSPSSLNGAPSTGPLVWSDGAYPSPGLRLLGSTVFLDINIPENRSVQVETSDNLKDWSLWDIPANKSAVFPVGPTTFSGPAVGPKRFFRLLIEERSQQSIQDR